VVAYFGALAVLLSVVPVYLAQRLAGSDSVRGSTVAR